PAGRGEQGPRPRPARDDPAPAGHGPRIPHLLPQRPRRTPDRRGGPCGGGDPGVISPGPPSGWRNPFTVAEGEEQREVSAADLLPSRRDLWQVRIDHQLQLIRAGKTRWTPVVVTPQGVNVDGHHAVRAAADAGLTVD